MFYSDICLLAWPYWGQFVQEKMDWDNCRFFIRKNLNTNFSDWICKPAIRSSINTLLSDAFMMRSSIQGLRLSEFYVYVILYITDSPHRFGQYRNSSNQVHENKKISLYHRGDPVRISVYREDKWDEQFSNFCSLVPRNVKWDISGPIKIKGKIIYVEGTSETLLLKV